jgi:hypothetical protein
VVVIAWLLDYNYLYAIRTYQYLSQLKLWVRTPFRRDVLDSTLCDKVCQWLDTCGWFSPGTPISSTNKTERHDIAKILLKVALNTINKQTKPIHCDRSWDWSPVWLQKRLYMCDLLFSSRYTTLNWLARSRYNTFKWSDLFQWDRTIQVQTSVLLYRIYPIELQMKDTTVRKDSCTWTGPDLCMEQCVPWHRTAKSWDSMLMTPLTKRSLKLRNRNLEKHLCSNIFEMSLYLFS